MRATTKVRVRVRIRIRVRIEFRLGLSLGLGDGAWRDAVRETRATTDDAIIGDAQGLGAGRGRLLHGRCVGRHLLLALRAGSFLGGLAFLRIGESGNHETNRAR